MPIADAPPPAVCRPAPEGRRVERPGGVSLWVRTVGRGRPVLYIPSLGRGEADFDDLARRMAKAGYMALLPDPRGTGLSTGPAPATLDDLAEDAAAAIGALCTGPIEVLGHAFGNRVARMTATLHPELVRSVALLAGGGEAQPTPEVRQAVRDSTAEGQVSDAVRLKALRLAFFAEGADPAVWLRGWWPKAATAQNAAAAATPSARWWKAGAAPVLLIQAAEDPVAPPANGGLLKHDLGDRLTLLSLPHASHAILPEQPQAVAAALTAYFDGERSEAKLQAVIDGEVREPR